MNSVLKYSFALFCALGPIYWFPFLNTQILSAVKIIIFTFLILSLFFLKIKNSGFLAMKNISFFMVLTIFLISVSMFFNGELYSHFYILFNYLIPLIILFAIPYLSIENRESILDGIRSSTKIFALFSMFVVLGVFFQNLKWSNPFYTEVDHTLITQVYTGFGGSRTGWSIGASFILCISLYNIYIYKNRLDIFFESLCFLFIALSVFIPSGRGGILVIFNLLIAYMLINFLKKKIPIFTVIAFCFGAFSLYFFKDYFRLGALFSGNLSEASNGRLQGNDITIENIMNNFLFGLGIEDTNLMKYGLDYPETHNVILNFIVKYGFLAFLPLCIFFSLIYYFLFFSTKNNPIKILMIFLLIAISTFSLTEPNVVFGNFFNTLVYWFLIAIGLSFNINNRIESKF